MNSFVTTAAGLAAALATGSASAGLRVVASVPGSDINVPAAGATTSVTFSGLTEEVSGFGITAGFTSPVADTSDGLYPWSVDFDVLARAPGGRAMQSPQPWFGDVSYDDYPVNDGFGSPISVDGNGTWTLTFDSGVVAPYVSGLRDVTYHLLAETEDVVYEYADTTDQGHAWSRPYFISAVSGLGPVDYHVLEFTVEVSGLYAFESVLDSGNNHFSLLYRDGFDDQAPLENLRDYGLGNGFSAFDVPQGTSAFSQLLFEGTTYYWVTSGWSASSPVESFTNTITGPGAVMVAGGACNDADLALPYGTLNIDDVLAFVDAFANREPDADVAAPLGTFNIDDVFVFLDAFAAGCP